MQELPCDGRVLHSDVFFFAVCKGIKQNERLSRAGLDQYLPVFKDADQYNLIYEEV